MMFYYKKVVLPSLIIAFLLVFAIPSALAQETVEAPENFEEARTLGERLLNSFPEAFKKTWQEAISLWKKMLNYVSPWFKGIWNSILSLLGKEVEQRKPGVEEEFEKEKQEMKEEIPKAGKSLWQRLKELIQ